MTRKDIERYEANEARKSILAYMDTLSSAEIVKLEKLVKDHKRIEYVLDFLRGLK